MAEQEQKIITFMKGPAEDADIVHFPAGTFEIKEKQPFAPGVVKVELETGNQVHILFQFTQ